MARLEKGGLKVDAILPTIFHLLSIHTARAGSHACSLFCPSHWCWPNFEQYLLFCGKWYHVMSTMLPWEILKTLCLIWTYSRQQFLRRRQPALTWLSSLLNPIRKFWKMTPQLQCVYKIFTSHGVRNAADVLTPQYTPTETQFSHTRTNPVNHILVRKLWFYCSIAPFSNTRYSLTSKVDSL